jgi:DNA-binding MarR family transcriptional regulator
MPIRADRTLHPDREPADALSYAPLDPGVETAWDQLDRLTSSPQGPARDIGGDLLVKVAGIVIEARQSRAHSLPSAIFGEPAWDILLALFCCPRSGEGERVSNLSLSSGTPATTALRWIDYLEREGFVTRRPSKADKRVVFVQLTDQARDAIGAYLASLLDKSILVVPHP